MKRLIISFLILFLVISGCKLNKNPQSKTTIRIMAAASLTEVFNELKMEFKKRNPALEIEVNYAGSQALAKQIELGAEADIYASANVVYMKRLEEKNLVIKPTVFARNKLIIGIFHGMDRIQSLADLLQEDVRLVIADQSVPVGRYTIKMLSRLGDSKKLTDNFKEKFLDSVVSKELDVKSVVRKIELGVVDAGVIYQTDVTEQNADKIKTIKIDDQYNVIAMYPIAILKEAEHKKMSRKFLQFLYSQKGGEILEKYGFMRESR